VKLPRRRFLHLTACAAALPAVSRIASAQTYPTRPVRIIVGFPAGGTGDINARLIGQWLSERLGQPFVVENRPGAAGNIAAEAVVRAPADGYTLLLLVATNTVNASLFDKLSFNLLRDIAPVAGLSRSPLVLEVNPAVSVNAVPEFIAYLKAEGRRRKVLRQGGQPDVQGTERRDGGLVHVFRVPPLSLGLPCLSRSDIAAVTLSTTHRPIRQQRRILTCRKPRHSTSVLSWKARSRWCSIPRKFILKSVILSCSEAPTTPGAIARTDPAGLPFHHMTAHNDGKILIADRHTHRFCSIPAGTGLERRQRADVV
jgi:hypothetical protein